MTVGGDSEKQNCRAKEGFCALYRGLVPTLVGIVPYSGIGFGIYHSGKATIRTRYEMTDASIPLSWRLGLGAGAGFMAQMAAYPFHIVRRRVQVRLLLLDI